MGEQYPWTGSLPAFTTVLQTKPLCWQNQRPQIPKSFQTLRFIFLPQYNVEGAIARIVIKLRRRRYSEKAPSSQYMFSKT
jgi:hypothetical protein